MVGDPRGLEGALGAPQSPPMKGASPSHSLCQPHAPSPAPRPHHRWARAASPRTSAGMAPNPSPSPSHQPCPLTCGLLPHGPAPEPSPRGRFRGKCGAATSSTQSPAGMSAALSSGRRGRGPTDTWVVRALQRDRTIGCVHTCVCTCEHLCACARVCMCASACMCMCLPAASPAGAAGTAPPQPPAPQACVRRTQTSQQALPHLLFPPEPPLCGGRLSKMRTENQSTPDRQGTKPGLTTPSSPQDASRQPEKSDQMTANCSSRSARGDLSCAPVPIIPTAPAPLAALRAWELRAASPGPAWGHCWPPCPRHVPRPCPDTGPS